MMSASLAGCSIVPFREQRSWHAYPSGLVVVSAAVAGLVCCIAEKGCDTALRVRKQGRIEADARRDRVSLEQVTFFRAEGSPLDLTQRRRMAAPAFIASTNSLEPL